MITPLAAQLASKYSNIAILLAARVGLGLGEGFSLPSTYAIGAQWYPRQEKTRLHATVLAGHDFGNILALILTPPIVISLGWTWSFYIFATIGIAWVILFVVLVTSTPNEHYAITEYEKAYLRQTVEGIEENKSADTVSAMKQMLTSSAVWAIIITHSCTNYGWFMIMYFLPKLLLHVGVEFSQVGWFSMLPYILTAVGTYFSGILADRMIHHWGISVLNVRTIMTNFNMIGSCVPFFLLRFAGHSIILTTILVCIGTLCHSTVRAGYWVNVTDVAPKHSSLLLSIMTGIGTLATIAGNLVTGYLLDIAPPQSEVIPTSPWDSVFNVVIVINLIGGVVYQLMAKDTPQIK
jgi:MFS family permease